MLYYEQEECSQRYIHIGGHTIVECYASFENTIVFTCKDLASLHVNHLGQGWLVTTKDKGLQLIKLIVTNWENVRVVVGMLSSPASLKSGVKQL